MKTSTEIKKTSNERDLLQAELKKMKANMDPGMMTVDDIMRRLKAADPAKFRDVMSDL